MQTIGPRCTFFRNMTFYDAHDVVEAVTFQVAQRGGSKLEGDDLSNCDKGAVVKNSRP